MYLSVYRMIFMHIYDIHRINILFSHGFHILLVKRSVMFILKYLFDQFTYFSFEQKLDMSSCQKITHIGLSSVFSCTICLEQVTLANGYPVSLYTSLCLSKS